MVKFSSSKTLILKGITEAWQQNSSPIHLRVLWQQNDKWWGPIHDSACSSQFNATDTLFAYKKEQLKRLVKVTEVGFHEILLNASYITKNVNFQHLKQLKNLHSS